MFTFRRASSFWISARFSFSRNEETSTGTCACTAPVFSFIASSWMILSTCRAVDPERGAQAVLALARAALRFHVDEVDDDQAAEVAQAQLARPFVGRFDVGPERGLLDVAALRGAGGGQDRKS